MVHPTRTTETRKRTVSCKTKTKQRRKKQNDGAMEMEDKEKSMTKKECILDAEVLVDLDHSLHSLTYFKRLQE